MKTNLIKLFAIISFVAALFMMTAFKASPIKVSAAADDAAATYKAKCAMCHSPAAAKNYDPAKPEDEQVQAILKGKKGEKPPFMPEFESKGITAEQAKGLVDYMKSLRAGN